MSLFEALNMMSSHCSEHTDIYQLITCGLFVAALNLSLMFLQISSGVSSQTECVRDSCSKLSMSRQNTFIYRAL